MVTGEEGKACFCALGGRREGDGIVLAVCFVWRGRRQPTIPRRIIRGRVSLLEKVYDE